MKKVVALGLTFVLAVFTILQVIPYGRDHTNPPVRSEPAWDSPQTRELVVRTCYDCHSNETEWRWYSNIAPMSWFIQRDVESGREKLNFSEWDRSQDEAGDAAESVQEGEMPPRVYKMFNAKGRLSDSERQALIRGLAASLGSGETEKEED